MWKTSGKLEGMATDWRGFIHETRGQLFWRSEVDFQVNGETYFLSLAEDARRWLVFVSTETGARAIPVYEDGIDSEDLHAVVEDKERRKILN